LDGQPREALVTAEEECRAAMARNAVARQLLEEVRPTLEAGGLPRESAALRTDLAVARNILERERAEAETLPAAREALARRTEAAALRQEELALA
jgi:hypothetical protein